MRRISASSVESYNDAVGSLEGRVLVSARRFRDLGITGEEVPEAESIQLGARRLHVPELNGCHPEQSEGAEAQNGSIPSLQSG